MQRVALCRVGMIRRAVVELVFRSPLGWIDHVHIWDSSKTVHEVARK